MLNINMFLNDWNICLNPWPSASAEIVNSAAQIMGFLSHEARGVLSVPRNLFLMIVVSTLCQVSYIVKRTDTSLLFLIFLLCSDRFMEAIRHLSVHCILNTVKAGSWSGNTCLEAPFSGWHYPTISKWDLTKII